MTQAEKQHMMATAPIPGLIARLSVPTIISMLITSFYNMADTFFVGKLGTSATAAVGVVFPLMSIIQALGFLFGHGSGNSVSRKLGAQKVDEAEHLASCGFFSSLVCGLFILIGGQLFLEPLSRILGSTDTILPYTKQYLSVILIGAPYMTASLTMNNLLRFQGSAFYAMIGITTGAVLNVILDPVFIFVFDMGIAGAAWATILSQLVSFVLLLVGMKVSNCVPLRMKNMKYLPSLIGQIFGGGLPSLCRQGLASLATVALNLAAGPYGDAAIAAMSIVMRIAFFAGSTVIGFGQGFQPVCGFNYGAGNIKRVKEAFWFCVKLATGVLIVLAILGFVFSGDLVAIFRKDDLEVIEIGTLALRMQCITLPLTGWIILNNMLFQTIGRTVPASVLAASRQGIFFLPAVLILPFFFGIRGVQCAQAVADAAAFVLALVLNRKLMPTL
ncbi:MAG: MATE family efflux transporter [Marvinbryantia sp.]|uniref:MATE family efflux transporter n=1 Tax=Marvinbryantia sp. TaxID=2496532 RepID=UPI00399B914B